MLAWILSAASGRMALARRSRQLRDGVLLSAGIVAGLTECAGAFGHTMPAPLPASASPAEADSNLLLRDRDDTPYTFAVGFFSRRLGGLRSRISATGSAASRPWSSRSP